MFTQQDLLSMKKFQNGGNRKIQEQLSQLSVVDEKSEERLYFSRYFLNNSFKILHVDIIETQQVNLSVTRFDSYMIYVIKVLTEDFSYDVRRRYSQFYKLYKKIMGFQACKGRTARPAKIDKINFENQNYSDYCFPIKKISSSLRNFFNITSKQKLAHQRKSQLSTFLNQIKNNYIKFPNEFNEDYVELLKFLNMKQQHQKYWRRKQGRYLQLSNLTLKDTNIANNPTKTTQPTPTQTINIQHLTQLLQHQINKINLAIIVNNSFIQNKPLSSSANLNKNEKQKSTVNSQLQLQMNDPMITDQIIKNVDCIKDIVLQFKRKINYDHIRCILKGKDIRQNTPSYTTYTHGGTQNNSNTNHPINSPSPHKKGLIEYSLKYSNNELVSNHILKIILDIFLNSQFNYSSDAFVKVLAQLQLGVFYIGQNKQSLMLENKELRMNYFRIVRQYVNSKEIYGNSTGTDRKNTKNDKFPYHKIMSLSLCSLYQKWHKKCEKNKQFKLKDEQKQWTLVIENFPQYYYPPKRSYYLDYEQDENINTYMECTQLKNFKKNKSVDFISEPTQKQNGFDIVMNADVNLYQSQPTKVKTVKQLKQLISSNIKNTNLSQINSFKNSQIAMKLQTGKTESYTYYLLKIYVTNDYQYKNKNYSYKDCVAMMKQEQKWNSLLVNSQLDVYSNTRKDFIMLPGKQKKMFRFVQQEEIQMDLCQFQVQQQQFQKENNQSQSKIQDIQCQNFVPISLGLGLPNQQDNNQHKNNPKMSTETMPSNSGSCAHIHQPQNQFQNYNQTEQISTTSMKYSQSVDQLAQSSLSSNITFIKCPPAEGFANSYYQLIKIQKISHKSHINLHREQQQQKSCMIQLEMIFTQPNVRKYFMSQIQGTTSYIWSGIQKLFVSDVQNQCH